ncbi:hypothetical protein V5R04_05765 [Jonesiaceae bacterium BS-20]|uniref:DUF2281 domain-containing protein n=1 Tax=Jonesiaceae bacterium BS-20 TaxID=3120821 RepID=A0AAU7E0V9_9MICO
MSPWEEEVAAATIGVLRNIPEAIRAQAFADGLELMATAPARYAFPALKKHPDADEEDEAL